MDDDQFNGDEQVTEQNFEEQPAFEETSEFQQDAEQIAQTVGGGDGYTTAVRRDRKDEDERKLFVGGLGNEINEDELREYFQEFGTISHEQCNIKMDPQSGRSRGFGFIVFESKDSIEAVMNKQSHEIKGKAIDPKKAKARTPKSYSDDGELKGRKIFVGGLEPDFPEEELRSIFSKYGEIEEIDLPFDKIKNQRRAFCFVTFKDQTSTDNILEVGKITLGDKEVDVKKASPKQESNQYGGRGGFGAPRGRGRGRGGGFQGGYGGGYNQGHGYGGNNYWGNGNYDNYYAGYGGGYGAGYGGYGGYDYSQGYGGNWGQGYDQNYYGNYGGGYDYSAGWGGYGQQGQGQATDGQQAAVGYQKSGGGGAVGKGYHPYQR